MNVLAMINVSDVLRICELRILRSWRARQIMELPVVDFSAENVCSNPEVLGQLHRAFVDIGFVFITNHGIEKHKVPYRALPAYRMRVMTQSIPTRLCYP